MDLRQLSAGARLDLSGRHPSRRRGPDHDDGGRRGARPLGRSPARRRVRSGPDTTEVVNCPFRATGWTYRAGTGLAFFLDEIARYAAGGQNTTLFSETLLASTRHERLREELGRVLYEGRDALARWVAGQRQAVGADPGDAEATAVALLTLLDGLVLHRIIDPELASIPVTGPLRRLAGLPETPAL
ncbi:hypothetical protein [Streptomyces aureus]